MVREVILQGLAGEEMRKFVGVEAGLRMSATVREDFVEDVLEDLEQMDESRLAGLGLTVEQLKVWRDRLSNSGDR